MQKYWHWDGSTDFGLSKDKITHVPNLLAEVLKDMLSRGVRGEREIKGIVKREAVEMVTDGEKEQKGC